MSLATAADRYYNQFAPQSDEEQMANTTMKKFGYPETQLVETGLWSIQVRPQQPTLGSLVLICREEATAFSEITAHAFADLQSAVTGIERVLRSFSEYQRLNYLMLMMVDPNVHFHVLPRYEGTRDFEGISFPDVGWPGPPRLDQAVALTEAQLATMRIVLKRLWDEERGP